MQILNLPAVNQAAGSCRLFTLVDDVATYDNVITAGYLSAQQELGHDFTEVDYVFVVYSNGQGTFKPSIDGNGVITLAPAFVAASANAAYFLQLDTTSTTFYANAGTSSGSAGNSTHCAAQKVIAMQVDGVTVYIPIFTQNT